MALFRRNQTEDTAKETAAVTEVQKQAAPASTARTTDRDLSSVLKKPRITEKAVGLIERNVYTFEIRQDATKRDVTDAVRQLFDVTPVKVRIVSKRPRHYMARMRGRKIMKKGLKKAYIYLKDGDRIDLA